VFLRISVRAARRSAGCGAVIALCCGLTPVARAETVVPFVPRTTYGDIGLLDMPSARMAPDGEVAVTVGSLQGSQRYNFSFQAFPWFEGSFRYSHISNFPSPAQAPGFSLFDRSLGIKVRLLQENDVLPEFSVGVRDLLGTGVYGAEYMVASKRIGDFDLTLGTGWGRLADSNALPNPFCKVSSRLCVRGGREDTGGTVNFGQFFRGSKVGVFGGVDWNTPIPNLHVLLEYSSDKYRAEGGSGFKVRSPVNVGLGYRLYDTVNLNLGWFYGSTYGLSVSFSMDPTQDAQPKRIGPDMPEPAYRTEQEQQEALINLLAENRPGPGRVVRRPELARRANFDLDEALYTVGNFREYEIVNRTLMINSGDFAGAALRCDLYARAAALRGDIVSVAVTDLDQSTGRVKFCTVPQSPVPAGSEKAIPVLSRNVLLARLRRELRKQTLELAAIDLRGSTLTVYYRNYRFLSQDEAIGRMARILMANAPPNVEIFRFVLLDDSMPLVEVKTARSALERTIPAHGGADEMGPALTVAPAPQDIRPLQASLRNVSPKLNWSFGPTFRSVFFDPEVPLQGQLYLLAFANLQLTPSFSIDAALEADIINNFNTGVPSNSLLPHVRTDLQQYFKEGANGINSLTANYTTRLAQDFYTQIKVGLLEDMFAGAGGQVLWRPGNGRWAFGADVYQVWQRNFDRLFGVQKYETVTGHASVYYQLPWNDLNVAVHAGRYLAKDYGATFEIRRKFSTGVEIGAFATFTNVPFARFGEGSFDKGIYIYIPFQWALPVFTRSAYPLEIRSITRDGGARLAGDNSLYRRLFDSSGPQMERHLDDIVQPKQ
jgi:hypothetical protein